MHILGALAFQVLSSKHLLSFCCLKMNRTPLTNSSNSWLRDDDDLIMGRMVTPSASLQVTILQWKTSQFLVVCYKLILLMNKFI